LSLAVGRFPAGDVRIGKTDNGVALVEFVDSEERAEAPRWQKAFWIESGGTEITGLIRALEDYLSGKRSELGWTVDEVLMRGEFQRRVLRATAEVPYGTVVTHQAIAEMIGRPRVARAVAQALRYNPVAIHIPCHRVIGSDGNLTGYAGNRVGIKRRILEVEGILIVQSARGLTIQKECMVVGRRRDRRFCRPSCSMLKNRSAGDRVFISSRTRAGEMGYRPCNACRPDGTLAVINKGALTITTLTADGKARKV
jgi:methylated-DNA-[protein]-cysteine S-methyltransferase